LPPIEIAALTKRFGGTAAVDDLSFTVRPGTVTGFLGPNGAGKTTTLRVLLGLVHATAGTATIGGRCYADLPDPSGTVGAVVEQGGLHPGRSGRDHLRALALATGRPPQRTEEVLELVGLTDAAGRRVKGYSLGMRQRLSLAAALLGDPEVLVLDEPANGLDPEGVRWLRRLLRARADSGGTVLVSSHGLAEIAQLADEAVVIAKGRLRAHSPIAELVGGDDGHVVVRTPAAAALADALRRRGMAVEAEDGEELVVAGASAAAVGAAAAEEGIAVHGLAARQPSLEEAFFALTADGDRLGEAS
jgi:ABC-2 type transport system ATP-binding protein